MAPKKRYRYMVIKRRERDDLPEIEGLKFGKHNAFTIGDGELAHDIDQRYGTAAKGGRDRQSVAVIRVADRTEQRRDGARVYFGSLPEMPWKRNVKSGKGKTRRKRA